MKKIGVQLMAGCLLAAMLLSGCGSTAGTSESPAGSSQTSGGEDTVKSISVSTSTAVVSLDPIHASDGFSVMLLGNVIGGLYSVDTDGVLQPELAESAEVSDDGLTYTFTLRDAEWSNGDPLTANDFVYAWRRLADPTSGTEYAYLVEECSITNASAVVNGEMDPTELGVTALDDKTLQVTLDVPHAYFTSMLAFTPFSPLNEAYVEAQGENFALTSDNTLYCGAFTVTDWDVSGNTVTMTKNPSYYDAANVDLDEVTFQVVADAQQGVMSYLNGDLDRVTLTGDLVSQYQDSEDFSSALGIFNWYLMFNDNKIDNEALRQAIAYCIDREDLVTNVMKDGSVAQYNLLMDNLYVNEDGLDFNDDCGKHYETDKDKAKELWAQAQQETDIRSFTLTYEEDSAFVANVAAYIQSEIETTLEGFTVNLESVPKKTRIEEMKSGEYEVALHRWGPDYADASCIMSLYTTDSPYNYVYWSNEEYDQLIESASTTLALDPDARWEAFKEAESIVMDSAVSVPLFQVADAVLTNPKVHGITNHITGVSCYYKYVTLDS